MSEIKDGGPAFPSPEWSDAHGNVVPAEYGMTLLDYFAAKAMQMHGEMLSDMDIDGEEAWDEYVAKRSYKTAAAMLKARE